jgi:hypothetical protein
MSDPYSGTYWWQVNGWFIFAISRVEIIEARRPEDLIHEKLLPMLGLAMPVHDEPRPRPSYLQKMVDTMREAEQKRH